MTYEMKELCVFCHGYEWMSCFTDNRCRSCHRRYIEEEYARMHPKTDEKKTA